MTTNQQIRIAYAKQAHVLKMQIAGTFDRTDRVRQSFIGNESTTG